MHWSWFLVAIYEIQGRAKEYGSPVWPILEYLSLFVIVLMHDAFIQTPAALPRIIEGLRAQGYRFVTASEMLGAPPPPYESPVPAPGWNIALLD